MIVGERVKAGIKGNSSENGKYAMLIDKNLSFLVGNELKIEMGITQL